MRQVDIPLDRLVVSTLNARKDLLAGQEDSGLEELAASIRQQGLLSPPIVRPTLDGHFEVLVGQRRLLACRRIGLDPVPCLVRDDLGDVDAVALSLVENVHRADMHPLDKARALKALHDRYQSYERVARESALSVSTVRKYIQLLGLPEELQKRLDTASGPAGVGALSRLATTFSGDEAIEVFEQISGFTQRIQEEILKRSGGKLGAIHGLVEEAHEGAFDMRRCGGPYGCEIIRDIAQHRLSHRDFERLVSDTAADLVLTRPSHEGLREVRRGRSGKRWPRDEQCLRSERPARKLPLIARSMASMESAL
jgi:ParB family chromosome partitioning protein